MDAQLAKSLIASANEVRDRLTLQQSPLRWHILLALITISATRIISPPIGAIFPPRPESLFGASEASFRLTMNSGTVAFLACALLGGAISDLYDRRKVLLAGVFGLIAANTICFASQTANQLTLGFVFTGISGAIAGAVVTSLLRLSFNREERPVAIGWYYATIGAAYLFGQLMLFLIDHVAGWRMPYVPPILLGIYAAKLAWETVPSSHAVRQGRVYQVIGICAWTLVLMALVVGVISYLTGDSATLYTNLSFAVGMLGAIGMAIVELEQWRPSVRRTMREFDLVGPPAKVIAAVILGGLALNFAFFGSVLLYFGYSTGVQGNGTIEASLMLIPCGIAVLIASLLSGNGLTDITVRFRTAVGMVLLGLGIGGLMLSGPTSEYWVIVLPLIAIGVGFSMASTGISTVLLSIVPADLAGVSAGVSSASAGVGRMLGSVWLALLLIYAGNAAYENLLEDAGVPESEIAHAVELSDTVIRNHNLGMGSVSNDEIALQNEDPLNRYLSAYTTGFRWAIATAAVVSLAGAAIIWFGLRGRAASWTEVLPSTESIQDSMNPYTNPSAASP